MLTNRTRETPIIRSMSDFGKRLRLFLTSCAAQKIYDQLLELHDELELDTSR
jgi:hypothetical protein